MMSGNDPWQDVVRRAYREWIASTESPQRSEARDPTLATTEQVLRDAGFVDVTKRELDVEQEWSTDDIVGYLFSTSHASRAIFGDLADEFATHPVPLFAHDPSGRYNETLSAQYARRVAGTPRALYSGRHLTPAGAAERCAASRVHLRSALVELAS